VIKSFAKVTSGKIINVRMFAWPDVQLGSDSTIAIVWKSWDDIHEEAAVTVA
jgi:hypothetical protein